MVTREVLLPRTYYTNGDRLYYIVEIKPDDIASVENCSTGYINDIPVDIIFQHWTEVKFRAIRT